MKYSLQQSPTVYLATSLFTGKVYNVTRFLNYHPGKKSQLMRGAGNDCTALFDKVLLPV